MNTLFMLMAQYEKPVVPLEECCDSLGYSYSTARRMASQGTFPVPLIQSHEGRKTRYQVHLQDLADYFDRKREEARKLFQETRAA